MRLKHLESALSSVDTFFFPDLSLEQYSTPSHIAAKCLFEIENQFNDFNGKSVADLGMGPGMLTIGAFLLGSAYNCGFELDRRAMIQSMINFNKFDGLNVDFIQGDITQWKWETNQQNDSDEKTHEQNSATAAEAENTEELDLEEKSVKKSKSVKESKSRGKGNHNKNNNEKSNKKRNKKPEPEDEENDEENNNENMNENEIDKQFNEMLMENNEENDDDEEGGILTVSDYENQIRERKLNPIKPEITKLFIIIDNEENNNNNTNNSSMPLSLYRQLRPPGLFDTVLSNPPFGTRRPGIDVEFIQIGLQLMKNSLYSFHKSSTREFLRKLVNSWGIEFQLIEQLKFPLEQSYSFHKEKSKEIEVDLIRFSFKNSEVKNPRFIGGSVD